MGLKINYNVSAMIANNSLKMADNKLSASLERLSSGYKINYAKDNAAGLAIARRMNAQVRGLSVAQQDAKDPGHALLPFFGLMSRAISAAQSAQM